MQTISLHLFSRKGTLSTILYRRAVGVAYDLDQSPVADRKMELSTVFADYDRGKCCRNIGGLWRSGNEAQNLRDCFEMLYGMFVCLLVAALARARGSTQFCRKAM